MQVVLFVFKIIVWAFIIYTASDYFICEILKRCFYKYRDETAMSDSKKALKISEIGVKAVVRMRRSLFFKSEYHVLVREIETILEQIPYE